MNPHVGISCVRHVARAAVALVLVAGTWVAVPANADSSTVCRGTIGKRSVDHLVVPRGATCRLKGTTVRQNVVVEERGTLITMGAKLLGAVHATKGPRSVRIINTDVTGNIHVREATRQVIIGDAGCRIDPAAGNNIHLIDNSGLIAVCQMTVRGNVHAIGNSGRVRIFDNRIGNNLHVRMNTGRFVRIRENRVGTRGSGNMDVDGNRDVLLRFNRVTNHMDCRDNRRLDGEGNRAAHGMRAQCARVR